MTDFAADKPFEYTDEQYQRLKYTGRQIKQKTFNNCVLTACVFNEVQFIDCRFYDCNFSRCDLSLIQLKNCTFVSTRFENTKAIGVNWTEAIWDSISPRKVDFYNCNLSYSTFAGLKLPGTHLKECILQDADFADANFTDASFTSTDFAGARFVHTNLTRADFTGARNYTISPTLNTITKAKFSLPEAISLLRNMEIVLIE